MTLGCADTYSVGIFNRCGTVQKCLINGPDISLLTYFKLMDRAGQAQVRVLCPCDCAADAECWMNTLVVYRDGEPAWGPGVVTQRVRDGQGVTLIAWDFSAWIFRRFVHEEMHFDSGTDLTIAAEALIRSGMRPDDPCGTRIIRQDCGVRAARSYTSQTTYVSDMLKELTDSGMRWTVDGTTYRLFGLEGLGKLATPLTEDHLVGLNDGNGATETQMGFDMATRAVVSNDSSSISAECGGVDPLYGLLEQRLDDTTVSDHAGALAAACAATDAYPPIDFIVPANTPLSPDTPISLEQLKPGMLIPVSAELGCRTTTQTLILDQVTVTWGGNKGESVAVVLLTPGGRRGPRTLLEVLSDMAARIRLLQKS